MDILPTYHISLNTVLEPLYTDILPTALEVVGIGVEGVGGIVYTKLFLLLKLKRQNLVHVIVYMFYYLVDVTTCASLHVEHSTYAL